ncbi:MAG: hypothetical protein H0V97_10045 [Actinobacteria bacterium]|nr:hypothetical protein [Actinomycetota bacterium]
MTAEEHRALIGRLRDAAPAESDRSYRAPGRANLIGEHTDYNGGFVLPVALDIATYVVGRAADHIALESLDEPGRVEVDIDDAKASGDGWGRYVAAVVKALRDDGAPIHGFEGVVGSEVPVGSGLSSSAALEVALVWALSSQELDATRIARICQRGERLRGRAVRDHGSARLGRRARRARAADRLRN